MSDPASYRPTPGSIPDAPGVYRFRDAEGRVIYVGKAKSLRPRLSSYFQDLSQLHSRTRSMVTTATSVDWTVVGTEVEALTLEYSWIKEFDPRFNVKYRDDKSYPYLAVTMNEEFPRVQVLRGARRKGVRYFGPYSHAWAIRDTVDQLLRVFPVRTCSNGVFKRAQQSGRPCLLGYIDKCSAPCVGRVDADEHRTIAEDFCSFVSGNTTPFMKALERRMTAAAAEQDYERAARLRDDLRALQHSTERNAMVLAPGTDADVVAVHEDSLEAAVQVFYVRDGRVRGRRGWVVEKVEDVDTAGLIEHFLQQVYGGDINEVPKEVLVPARPEDGDALERWLTDLRGSRVAIRVPQRGDKRALMETVERNAAEALTQHRVRRASDLTTRSRALQDVQDALDLPEAPLRIECVDISHVQGTEVVGSLVVFEDGLPKKADYRRFNVKGFEGSDDVRAVEEVVRRRFLRYVEEQAKEHEPGVQRRSFAYRPQLLVIDGGPAQAAAAARAVSETGVEGIAVVGLAKRLEELWPANSADPVLLPRGSDGLYLLQRVRDEAHRFAISFHRQRRSTAMTRSALDDIPGLGPARRAALLKHFGSLRALKQASPDDITAVPGFGPATAVAVVQALHGDSAAPAAINTATGEIMEP